MQIITAVGRVGKDAELRTLPNGTTKVSNFSLAADGSRKGQYGKLDTPWFSIPLFGTPAEPASQCITKGKVVAVSGEVSAGTFTHNNQTKVDLRSNGDKVKLLGGGGESKPKPAPADDWLNGGSEEPF